MNLNDLQNYCIKFFATSGDDLADETYIEIFQDWIRKQELDEILIDIADYRHVPEGPGMMLVCHELNYSMDRSEGPLGLMAQRKRPHGDSLENRLRLTLKSCAAFMSLLEKDERATGLQFDAGSFVFLSNDRLRLPNTDDAFGQIAPILEKVAGEVLGSDIQLERVSNHSGDRLAIQVNGGSLAAAELSGKLAA